MKKLKTLVAFAIVSALMMSGSVFSAPQMTIKESIFNFGFVPQNSKAHANFWLYSTGDDTLKIIKVVPG